MTANPVIHQYWAKLNIQVHKDLYDHGDQAGQQEAGHGSSPGEEQLGPDKGLGECQILRSDGSSLLLSCRSSTWTC